MKELPEKVNDRFKLYLVVLPVVEQAIMYLSFLSGVILILYVTYKILYTNRSAIASGHKISKGHYNKQHWLDQNLANKDVENRLNDYIKVEKRHSMTSKELEVYYNGLITPLNQEITDEEFRNMKEEIV